ncbi:unnamed protein product, partial [Mycena citricolor]
ESRSVFAGISLVTRSQNFSSSRTPTSRVDVTLPSSRTASHMLTTARATPPASRGNRTATIVSSSAILGAGSMTSANLCAPKKVAGPDPERVANSANPSAARTRSRPGTTTDARWPIHLLVPRDSTRGLSTPSTSDVARSMSSRTIHFPCRMARTSAPSRHSNVPGCVGDDMYDPSSDRASKDVSERWIGISVV